MLANLAVRQFMGRHGILRNCTKHTDPLVTHAQSVGTEYIHFRALLFPITDKWHRETKYSRTKKKYNEKFVGSDENDKAKGSQSSQRDPCITFPRKSSRVALAPNVTPEGLVNFLPVSKEDH